MGKKYAESLGNGGGGAVWGQSWSGCRVASDARALEGGVKQGHQPHTRPRHAVTGTGISSYTAAPWVRMLLLVVVLVMLLLHIDAIAHGVDEVVHVLGRGRSREGGDSHVRVGEGRPREGPELAPHNRNWRAAPYMLMLALAPRLIRHMSAARAWTKEKGTHDIPPKIGHFDATRVKRSKSK